MLALYGGLGHSILTTAIKGSLRRYGASFSIAKIVLPTSAAQLALFPCALAPP